MADVTIEGTDEPVVPEPDVNDLEHIMALYDAREIEEIGHAVDLNADALFTWDYDRSRPALSKLYEKAKTSQWNAATDLDWSTPVDIEQVVMNNQAANASMFFGEVDLTGTPFAKWTEKQWLELGIE